MSFKQSHSIIIALLLIVFAVVSRLAPHPANVAPLAAVALFAGAILPRKLAVTVPLAAMVVSDMVLGMHSLVYLTWGSFVVVALVSSYSIRSVSFKKVVASSLAASIFFYLVTNFGVWAEGRMYAMTLEGLAQCYYNALPFFRNTLIGDMAYSGLLFGVYALATSQHTISVSDQRTS